MSRMTAVVCTVIIVVIGLLGSLVGGWHPAYVTLTIVLPMAFVLWTVHRKENAQQGEFVVVAPAQEGPAMRVSDPQPKDSFGSLMEKVFLPKTHPDFPDFRVIEDDAHLKKLNHYLISKSILVPLPFVLTSRREGPEQFPAMIAYLIPGPKFKIRFKDDTITCYKISDARSHAAKLKEKEVAVV